MLKFGSNSLGMTQKLQHLQFLKRELTLRLSQEAQCSLYVSHGSSGECHFGNEPELMSSLKQFRLERIICEESSIDDFLHAFNVRRHSSR